MYARTRWQGGLSPLSLEYTYKRQNQPDLVTQGVSESVGTHKITKDVVVPSFRKRVQEGSIFNNPFESTTTTVTGSPSPIVFDTLYPPPWNDGSTYKVIRPAWSATTLPVDFPLNDLSDPWVTEAATAALSSVERPEVDGAVFLAELRQSINTMRAPLSGALAALEGARQGSVKGTAKGLADWHLSLIFGILPFLMDIEAILGAIRPISSPPRKTARGFSSHTSTLTRVRETHHDSFRISGTITDTFEHTWNVRAGSLYSLDFNLGVSRFGLSISDIPVAMWKLLGYSFIVDWLFNVSEYIRALTPSVGVKTLAEWITITETRRTTSVLGNSFTHTGMWKPTGGGGDSWTRVVEVKRRVPTVLGDHIGLVYNPSIGTGQVLSLLSLLTQKVGFFERSWKQLSRASRDSHI